MRPRLLLFLKAPRVGAVKTRLARDVGSEKAAQIYRQLVGQQLRALPRDWPIEVHFTPADAREEMRAWLGSRIKLVPQVDGDLGARLAAGFAKASRSRPVVALGGDCPEVDCACLLAAQAALSTHDVVLGPAVDGGYYLIGARSAVPTLFSQIPWSTCDVYDSTLKRAAAAGLTVHSLDRKEDIDDGASWQRYGARVEGRSQHDVLRDLGVIIPALNEANGIAAAIAAVRRSLPGNSICVVDGGSADATVALARAAGADVITSERGRGVQCHAGAQRTFAEWLLFLHADTHLPDDAAPALREYLRRADAAIATFRLRFDRETPFLRACAWLTRFDSVFTRFGDQGILVRRSFYQALGGFPAWPLFEDVELLGRARRHSAVHSLPAKVTTSSRRFRAHGHLRQQLRNTALLLRFLCGASPHALARKYDQRREPRKPSAALALDARRPAAESASR